MSLNLSSSFSGFNLKMDKAFGQTVYAFEDFCLDADQLMLSRDGEEIALPPKVIETLLVLVENRGKIVSKDDLLEAVWKDVIVEESNLYGYLHVLRNTLGDQANGKPFIETLRRRGYRFNGEVRVVRQDHDSSATLSSPVALALDNEPLTHPGIFTDRKIPLAAVIGVGILALVAIGSLFFGKPIRTVDAREYTNSDDAHRLYLEGYDLAQRLTPENYRLAIERFREAIDLDPNYPSPYVGIATANRVNMLSADVRPIDRVSMGSGKLAALKAVELAPELAEAHVALGMITFFYDWDWKAAEEQLTRGYELNPDLEDTNIQLAHFYSNMGRHEDAIRLSTKAREIDTLIDRSQALHGMILFYARRYDESIEHLKKRIEFKPDYWFYHFNLQRSYLEKGRYQDALDEGELAKQYGCPSLELIVQRAYAYERMGDTKKAREALADLVEVAKNGYVGPYLLALTHNVLGDTEQALSLLEEAYQVRDWRMTFLKVDPRWNNLRSQPRFVAITRKMNF